MTPAVAILEDHPDRVTAMQAVLAEVLPGVECHFFPGAPEMLAWLRDEGGLARAVLISLDHDLDSVVPVHLQHRDPGCGRDVADWLASQPAVCPVVVHTTNEQAAPGMMRVLRERGWPVWRVYPRDGHAWIGTDWASDLRDLIRRGWIVAGSVNPP